MKIEDFWNQAFISALARLPANDAKAEADQALQLCIKHWQGECEHLMLPVARRWADADVSLIPFVRGQEPG